MIYIYIYTYIYTIQTHTHAHTHTHTHTHTHIYIYIVCDHEITQASCLLREVFSILGSTEIWVLTLD